MNDFSEFDDMLGIAPKIPTTPHHDMYMEWIADKNFSGKYISPKIYNYHYWLRHELAVYTALKESGISFVESDELVVISKEQLARELSRYFFQMHAHTKFYNERAREQGKEVDIEKFLDLILEHDTTKALIADHRKLL